MRPPIPIPRFIVTRCIAKTTGRCARVASPERSVDCEGQKAPLPIPIVADARKPSQAESTKAYWPIPSIRKPSAIVSIRFPPTRSTSAPATGPASRLTPAFVASTSPAVARSIPRSLCR